MGMHMCAETLENHLQFLYKFHVHFLSHLRPPGWLGSKRVHVFMTCTMGVISFVSLELAAGVPHTPHSLPDLPHTSVTRPMERYAGGGQWWPPAHVCQGLELNKGTKLYSISL